MDNKERVILDLTREDDTLNKRVRFDELYEINTSAFTKPGASIEDTFRKYLDTCKN